MPIHIRLGEMMADRWIHRAGVCAGLVAAAVLIGLAAAHDDASRLLAVLVYAAGLVTMLGCSAAYNLTPPSPRKQLLRRFDHAAIFVMIAGTYTPLMVGGVGGAWGFGMSASVWLVALIGASVKLCFPGRFERLAIVLYLLLGWSVTVALGPLLASFDGITILLLGIGGVLYSLGVVFHLWEALPFHRAIWHVLVLVAAGCHYWAVLDGVVLAGPGA